MSCATSCLEELGVACSLGAFTGLVGGSRLGLGIADLFLDTPAFLGLGVFDWAGLGVFDCLRGLGVASLLRALRGEAKVAFTLLLPLGLGVSDFRLGLGVARLALGAPVLLRAAHALPAEPCDDLLLVPLCADTGSSLAALVLRAGDSLLVGLPFDSRLRPALVGVNGDLRDGGTEPLFLRDVRGVTVAKPCSSSFEAVFCLSLRL